MGYFSNGTEGMKYQEEYCNNCIHLSNEGGCPILDIHFCYNYEQNDKDKKDIRYILEMLIPMRTVASGNSLKLEVNGQCSMYAISQDKAIATHNEELKKAGLFKERPKY